MRNSIKLISLLALLAGVARAEGDAPPSTEDAMVVNLADAKWKPAPKPNEAIQTAGIAMEPTSKASVSYAKFPPGQKLATHWHSAPEYTVLISGNATFTIEGKDHAVGPGSYFVIPAKVKHSLTCDPGAECILLTRRGGATDYHWEDAK